MCYLTKTSGRSDVEFLKRKCKLTAGGAIEKRKYRDIIPEKTKPVQHSSACSTVYMCTFFLRYTSCTRPQSKMILIQFFFVYAVFFPRIVTFGHYFYRKKTTTPNSTREQSTCTVRVCTCTVHMYTHVPFQRYDVTEFAIHEMLMSRDVTVVFVNKDQLSLIKGPQNAFFLHNKCRQKGGFDFSWFVRHSSSI